MNKTVLTIILLSAVLILSCKKKQKSEESEEQITIEMKSEESVKSSLVDEEKSGDCDDFIDDYEKWMDEYVALLGEYKENPMGLVASEKYTSMSMEMMNWSSKWSELAVDCASDPEYEERINKIQEKADKEMEALGLK